MMKILNRMCAVYEKLNRFSRSNENDFMEENVRREKKEKHVRMGRTS